MVMFGFGQYSNVSNGNVSVSIQNTAIHEWLTLGVRGVYDIKIL
jgi:hypothetical protein